MTDTKKKKPEKKRTVLNHGGKKIEIPVLTGPVGRPSAELLKKYPTMNAPADVAIVDHYLQQLKAIKNIQGKTREHPLLDRILRLFRDDGAEVWDDRDSAIEAMQKVFNITDREETQFHIIKPDGPTLITLVDYGDIAEQLLRLKISGQDYTFYGTFNKEVLKSEFTKYFDDYAKRKGITYSPKQIPATLMLVGFMENDRRVIDIRWMAYMLATAMLESRTYEKESVAVLDKKTGLAKKDKNGAPVMRRVSRMLAMTPIDETGHGSGRNYYLPAKVKRNPDGTVTVTEMDGDQFSIGLNGKPTPLNRGGKRGTSPSTVASETYVREVGVERRYYGRGYVQLTWWDNYAAAGVSLGYGLDFVMDPEKVKTPEVAYKIMAFGMLTGGGYANGRRFEHYFYGTTTDYAGARAMVNKNDPQQEIVDNAKLFEAILLRAAIR